MYFIYEVKICR